VTDTILMRPSSEVKSWWRVGAGGDGFGFAVVVGGGLLAHHVADDALLDGPRLGEGAEEGGPRHRLSLGQPLEFILLRFRFPQTHFR
jgi:hypothetical protein